LKRAGDPVPDPAARRPDTAEDLLSAGIDLFGRHGYEAVSTRALAEAAGANVSAIRYHFGGKDGLYLACLDAVVDSVRPRLAQARDLAAHARELAGDDPRARAVLVERVVRAVLEGFLGHPELRRFLPLVLRELLVPGDGFPRLYEALPRPLHETLTELVAWLDDRPADDPATIVRTHALLGSLVVFHLGRPILLARLGAEDLDAALLETIVVETQRVVLAALRLPAPEAAS
jgi:AcrR family transcriptional regulator